MAEAKPGSSIWPPLRPSIFIVSQRGLMADPMPRRGPLVLQRWQPRRKGGRIGQQYPLLREPLSFRHAISERPPHLRAQDPHVGLVGADEAPTWNGGCRLLIHEVA